MTATLLSLGIAASALAFAYSFLTWVAYGTHRLRPVAALAAFTLGCALLALTLSP